MLEPAGPCPHLSTSTFAGHRPQSRDSAPDDGSSTLASRLCSGGLSVGHQPVLGPAVPHFRIRPAGQHLSNLLKGGTGEGLGPSQHGDWVRQQLLCRVCRRLASCFTIGIPGSGTSGRVTTPSLGWGLVACLFVTELTDRSPFLMHSSHCSTLSMRDNTSAMTTTLTSSNCGWLAYSASLPAVRRTLSC
jgi:hypothetical protein